MISPKLEKQTVELAELYRFENGMVLSGGSELEKWRAETLFTKEPGTISWIDFWSKENGTLYDVGANIGGYSTYAAYGNTSLNVCSFEPVLNNYSILLKNKELNNLKNLSTFNMALSSRTKLEVLYISDERVGNSGAQIGAPVNELGDLFEPVAKEMLFCLSLDEMIEKFGFPIPTFIKIDVDGHEMDILLGSVNTLMKPEVKSILIECNGVENKEKIESLLVGKGFSLDDRFNNLENHSSKRRAGKSGNVARNIIYTRF